jgi:hypothetical protein
MAVQERVVCDICGKPIREGRVMIRVETGSRRHSPPVDLCPGHASEFFGWIDGEDDDREPAPRPSGAGRSMR